MTVPSQACSVASPAPASWLQLLFLLGSVSQVIFLYTQCSLQVQVSDLDGTMVGEGPEADAATLAFCRYWENTAALAGGVLVYNTGRSLGQFQELLQTKADCLAVPNALITAVGTKVCSLSAGHAGVTTLASSNWACWQPRVAVLDLWPHHVRCAAGLLAARPPSSDSALASLQCC